MISESAARQAADGFFRRHGGIEFVAVAATVVPRHVTRRRGRSGPAQVRAVNRLGAAVSSHDDELDDDGWMTG